MKYIKYFGATADTHIVPLVTTLGRLWDKRGPARVGLRGCHGVVQGQQQAVRLMTMKQRRIINRCFGDVACNGNCIRLIVNFEFVRR